MSTTQPFPTPGRRVLATAFVLSALLLSACQASDAVAPPSEPTGPVEPTPTTPDGDAPAPTSVDWWTTTETHDLGGGWTAARCEGDAPLVCLVQDGRAVGAVEFMSFPVADPPTGDPVEWLRERADDFAASLVADRAIGCGEDYVLDFRQSAQIGADGVTWIVYSFTGTTAEGEVVEQGIAHLTVQGHVQTILGANAYDEGGCLSAEGSLWTVEDLSVSRGTLDRLAAATIPGTPEVTSGIVHGFVTAIDGDQLTIDTVEFLSGDEAVRAAVADGELAEGEDLPNDVYVRNRTTDALVLTAGPQTGVSLIDCTNGCQPTDADLTAWLDDPTAPYGGPNALYAFTLGEGDLVHVAEQYLP